MTGILNRRKMQEMFTLELNRVKRNKESLTVAVIDLDKFKAVNDNFGHECGDKVIISSANAFAQECREIDHISRWGGEEFLCLFVDTNIDSAIEIAERLRSALEKQSYPCLNCTSVTASIGLAQYEEGDSMEQLIARADKALYKAKSSGRNRVEVSGKAKRII
jgi:polar amino acid transport system substrate-binding protein